MALFPPWAWLVFGITVLGLLAVDLFAHRGDGEESHTAGRRVGEYGAIFGGLVRQARCLAHSTHRQCPAMFLPSLAAIAIQKIVLAILRRIQQHREAAKENTEKRKHEACNNRRVVW